MAPLGSLALLAAGTCVASATLTWLCIQVSRSFGLTAAPRSDRWHKLPTPNTGGVAIFLSCAIVCLAAGLGRYSVIASAAAAIAILGFIDDRLQLSPVVKFAGQSLAVICVIASGVSLQLTGSYLVNGFITFFWIAGVTNAFNLIDNMDGLCAGVTVIICSFRVLSSLQNGDMLGAVVLSVMAGGFSGFLIFNYKPAKIFMGDAGSMFAGFSLASLAIATPIPQTRVFLSAILYPALTFLYPIFDTVFVSILRKLAGRRISVGGRDHSSHRLASLGVREDRVVWILWALTAVGGAGGLLTYSMPFGVWAIAFFLVLAITIFGMFLADLPGYEIPQTALQSAFWFRKCIPTLRAGVIVIIDTLIAGVCLLVAFLVKWEDDFSGERLSELLRTLPVVMGCQVVTCLALRTFNLGWRWIGLQDVLSVGRVVLFSSGTAAVVTMSLRSQGYSRGILLLYCLLSFSAMTGYRSLLGLLWRTLGSPCKSRNAALLGSVQSSEFLILLLQRRKDFAASPTLIFDLDRKFSGTRIHGVPICSTAVDPSKILRVAGIDLLVISEPGVSLSSQQQRVLEACSILGIPAYRFDVGLSPVEGSPISQFDWPASVRSSAAASVG